MANDAAATGHTLSSRTSSTTAPRPSSARAALWTAAVTSGAEPSMKKGLSRPTRRPLISPVTAARAARHPRLVWVPGVSRGAVVPARPCRPGDDLVHVELAEDDRAGRAKAAHDGGAARRHGIIQDLPAAVRPHTRRVEEILEP